MASPGSPAAAGGVRLGLIVVVVLVPILRIVIVFGLKEVGRVQVGALLHADVDKRGLDSAEDCFYPAEIYVANGPPVIGPIDQEFDQTVVLENWRPSLAGCA